MSEIRKAKVVLDLTRRAVGDERFGKVKPPEPRPATREEIARALRALSILWQICETDEEREAVRYWQQHSRIRLMEMQS